MYYPELNYECATSNSSITHNRYITFFLVFKTTELWILLQLTLWVLYSIFSEYYTKDNSFLYSKIQLMVKII